jgi:hypothetical protein
MPDIGTVLSGCPDDPVDTSVGTTGDNGGSWLLTIKPPTGCPLDPSGNLLNTTRNAGQEAVRPDEHPAGTRPQPMSAWLTPIAVRTVV